MIVVSGRIGGSILAPGIYKWTTGVTIATGITISGGPTDSRSLIRIWPSLTDVRATAWIFQVSGSFNQAANASATLVGGALPQNIFWAIAGTVTVGTNAIFQGNILAKTNVDIDTNATNNGCIYAQTAVNLKEATVLCSGGTIAPPIPPTSAPATSAPATTAPPTVTSTPTSSSATATFSPQCTPTAAPCFTVEFQNLNASIQGDDFLTFTLADTVQGSFFGITLIVFA